MRAEATARQAYRGPGEQADPGHAARMADLLLELAPTLDGLAGHEAGHAVRTCFLAMRLAEAMSISDRDRLALFYASLLHDAGSVADADPSTGPPGDDAAPDAASARARRTSVARPSTCGCGAEPSSPRAPASVPRWR